jgi:hypothetical protein
MKAPPLRSSKRTAVPVEHASGHTNSTSTNRRSNVPRWHGKLLAAGLLVLTYPAVRLLGERFLLTTDRELLALTDASIRPIMEVSGQLLSGRQKQPGDSNTSPSKTTDESNKGIKLMPSWRSHANLTSQTCLTTKCLQSAGRSLARAFLERHNRSEWCLGQKARHPNKEGLILVKVPKAASSTSAGVALRIANRHNCHALQWQHKPGTSYAKRYPKKSFLFTSVRDPASRVLSYLFFMEISIGGVPYSDEWMLDRLKHFSGRYGSIEDGQGGFTMQFAALEPIPHFSAWSPQHRTRVVDAAAVRARVQSMLEGYDFILVVDRLDESLVAMSLLLDIDVGDILVTSSKVGGSFFYDPPRNRCVSLTKSFTSPAVQAYLDSDDWKAQNYGDYLLHAAANRSLDLTIERLGAERFKAALHRYRQLQQLEKQVCADHVQFPCSKEGKPQTKLARRECYQRDFGCGYNCIDDMIESSVAAKTLQH